MAKKDGGPAFPGHTVRYPDGRQELLPEEGMTLRQYYVGQALAGITANHALTEAAGRNLEHADGTDPYAILGRIAVAAADAAIAEEGRNE